MLVIGDYNWSTIPRERGILPRFIRYGSQCARRQGLRPIHDFPDLLIPEDEWKGRIQQATEHKVMPVFYFRDAGVLAKSQGRTNWCWAYGITSALESVQLVENQPHVRLAPATLGWTVGWHNVANWCSDAIAAVAERGVASSVYAKDGITNPKLFEKGWEEDARNYKLSEWFDVETHRTEKETVKQCVSLLLTGLPLYVAYNWWGHALAIIGIEWDEAEKYNLRWIGWNSHGDGEIVLTGSRGVPDEAYAPRSSTFSIAKDY